MSSLAMLEEILQDTNITDVMFDGYCSTLVESNGELREIPNSFQSESEIENWVRKLLHTNGSRLDIANPISEVTIETKFGLLRIHVVLAGECSKRTQISIRRHSVISLSLEEMVRNETLDTAQAEVLKEIIQNKENFVILGGTGSGKTTLLKAMLSQVSDERIITIEDAAELFLLGRSVSLTTRSNNHEGVGEITLARLLREALRMRPDRLVIGETRGEELLLLLQAMNTGHSGSGFTIHANTMHDFIPRVLAIMAGIGISPELTKVLVNSAINWVVEVQRLNGKRKVTNIRRLSELNV